MGWRQRQARQPERNLKLISVLQCSVLSFKKKKKEWRVFVSVFPVRRKHDLNPAGNRPFLPNRLEQNSQGWCECNDDTHKQLDAHTVLVSDVQIHAGCIDSDICPLLIGFNHNLYGPLNRTVGL